MRRYPRGAAVVFLAVLSHWLLDFVSHRPDMSLAPGVNLSVGLGLSDSRVALLVEGLLWLDMSERWSELASMLEKSCQ